jgi:hypothetical protein
MQGDTAPPQPDGGQQGPGQPNQQPGGHWDYRPDDNRGEEDFDQSQQPIPQVPQPRGGQSQPDMEASWTASEFIAHSKSPTWYIVLAVGTLVLVVFLYVVSKDFFSIIVVIIMAILVALVARRKPRVLEYHLDRAGVAIGPKFYPYGDFRSFSIVNEGAFSSIMFSPLKRFMTPVNIYYDPKDEQQIVNVLSQYLPFEQRSHDAIDRFARRIRF